MLSRYIDVPSRRSGSGRPAVTLTHEAAGGGAVHHRGLVGDLFALLAGDAHGLGLLAPGLHDLADLVLAHPGTLDALGDAGTGAE